MKLRVVRNIQALRIREIGKKNREKQRSEKMSEIRDRVINKLVEIQTSDFSVDLRRRKGFTEAYIKRANQILSIPEIAIVDREAELPTHYGEGMSQTAKTGYGMAQMEMRKEGYVKEIKDD